MEKLAFNSNEAGIATGKPASFINRMIREGRIAAKQVGGRNLIMADELKRFLEECQETPSRRGVNARTAINAREWRKPHEARDAEPKAAPTPRPVRFEHGVAVK
jgi:excisionase family DNA binding protein